MTIDLGFGWFTLPSGEQLAFVDVPGHERFVPNMLAGAGPVPAVMFVVAADEGWMPQSAEHLAVIDALGIRSGLLVITKSDLADPAAAMAQAGGHIAESSLGPVPAVAVSAQTGAGLTELTAALDLAVQGAARARCQRPGPDLDRPVVHDERQRHRRDRHAARGHRAPRRRAHARAVDAPGDGAGAAVARRDRGGCVRHRPGRAQPARREQGRRAPRHGARAGRPVDAHRRRRRADPDGVRAAGSARAGLVAARRGPAGAGRRSPAAVGCGGAAADGHGARGRGPRRGQGPGARSGPGPAQPGRSAAAARG